ncbi:MAG: EAL domain-containing protein [Betaproteobacteria bacterium]
MNDRTSGPLQASPGAGQEDASYAGLPRDTQLEYRAILGNASIGIAFTRDRKFFLCNARFAEMLGWTPEELIGQGGDVVYPSRESYEALGALAIPLLGAGKQLDIEWEIRRKDGSSFPCRLIAKAINPASTQQGTIWIAEDITERRRRADEVARLLREQDAIFNTASIGICFVRDRRIVRCNRRFEEQHGHAPGELIGRPTIELYATPEDYNSVGEAYAMLAAGRSVSSVTLARRKDGGTYWARSTGSAIDPANPERGSVWLDEDISDQKRAEEELQRVLAEQQALSNNVVVGITFVRDRKVARCNRRFEELFGYAPGEAAGLETRQLYFTDEQYEAGGRDYASLNDGGYVSHEWLMRRRDGSSFWCRVSGRAVQPGEPARGTVWLFEDITDRKRADEDIQRMVREQELILENAAVGIVFVRDYTVQRCNRRGAEMLGYVPEEMAGMPVSTLHADAVEAREVGGRAYDETPPGGTFSADSGFRRKDGTTFIGRTVGKRVDPGDVQQQWIWILEDVTAEHAAREALERAVADRTQELVSANRRLEAEIADRKQAETRAQHLADHDPLTGLPNRRLLEDRLMQAIARGDRNQKPTAVMFVDLDRFKAINDTLGHAVGDVLLKEVSERLVRQLRVGDTVCRIGGDEFVVVLPEVTRSSDAAGVAQKIIETVSLPIAVDDRELQVSVSIGISVFPDDGRDVETLIRNADAAMYHAKETGRSCYQFFTEQMNLAASRRVAVEADLRRAVQDNALRVHYQPVVESGAGATVGYEALVRWQHPARGIVAAADFLQLAEDTGLILRIGEWVLREACRWISFVGAERALPVSVNLSARQFADPRLADLVAGVLKDAGVPPKLLQLELSEATAMQNADHAEATLRKLKGLGVTLSLDNFGSAFSSTTRLRRFSLDRLKLDRSLVAELVPAAGGADIVGAMTGLAHAMGLKVVAEGVETESQRDLLKACGCDYLQGYLIGRPAEAAP